METAERHRRGNLCQFVWTRRTNERQESYTLRGWALAFDLCPRYTRPVRGWIA